MQNIKLYQKLRFLYPELLTCHSEEDFWEEVQGPLPDEFKSFITEFYEEVAPLIREDVTQVILIERGELPRVCSLIRTYDNIIAFEATDDHFVIILSQLPITWVRLSQSIPDRTLVKFEIKDHYLEHWEHTHIKNFDGHYAMVTSFDTATEMGDKDYEYYNIQFLDPKLTELEGISGYHLTPTPVKMPCESLNFLK